MAPLARAELGLALASWAWAIAASWLPELAALVDPAAAAASGVVWTRQWMASLRKAAVASARAAPLAIADRPTAPLDVPRDRQQSDS